MGRKKDDAHGVERVAHILEVLGCPDIRRAQGTEEWRKLQGPFASTPDLVAGPIVGGGAPVDFMIDVFEPSGDPYVKVKAGNPAAAETFGKAVEHRGSFTLGDLGENYDHFYEPLNKKMARYGTARNSPMVGLAMYFSCAQGGSGGVALGHLDALRALDRAFGIGVNIGEGQLDRCMMEVCEPGHSLQILVLPLTPHLSFLLYLADKEQGQKIILLVSASVLISTHPFREHPVVDWLIQVAVG